MKVYRLALLLASWASLARADYGDGYESAADGMSKQMLCEVITLGSGNLALLAGLFLALGGLWQMVRHGALKSGIIMVIAGALLTALPSLVLSFLGGVSSFLNANNISKSDAIEYIQESQQAVGNCGSIPVDWSSYLKETVRSFSPNMGSEMPSNNGKAGSASIDPNAKPGALGCADIVDNGVPSSPFGPRVPPSLSNGGKGSSNHKGVDIGCGAHPGSPVHAAASGTIAYVGKRGCYGNSVIIDHGGGVRTTYNHFERVGDVKYGQSVGARDVIGFCGNTGCVNGKHVHFEYEKNGVLVDPVANGCGH